MAERELKLLVADDDVDELDMLFHELYSLGRGRVLIAAEGVQTVDMIVNHAPDVLLLDMVMPGMDGLGIIRRIRSISLPRLPHIIAMVEPGQQALAGIALELGAGVILQKEQLPGNLLSSLNRAIATPRRRLLGGAMAENRLYSALIEVGIARHLDGFDYLMEAILLALEDVDYQNNFSKCLYPAVARRYNTSASCVERSIRHAVEAAWSRTRLSVLQREFGNTIDSDRGKPTNSEFIARMADKMRNGGSYLPRGD